MDFALSDEQQMLFDSSRRFIASEYTFEQRAKLLESDLGWSRDVWQQMAELGLLAVDIPENEGGIGAGAIGVMLVSQAVGEGLLLEPFLSSAVLATRAIVRLGSVEQRVRWLPALADGSLIAVLAHDETHSGIEVTSIDCRATRSGDGWTLSGRKAAIYHAESAALLLVSARCEDGTIGVFALTRDTAGVSLSGFRSVDGQRAAHIELVDAAVGTDARLGDDASVALQAVVDYGLAAYCAEAFGSLERILKATIDYSRARSQFGAPIGSFQALQHRMADLLIAAEQARSMVYLATSRSDDPDPARRRAALSGAKVLIGQAARLIGQQAVQLHGGMGMTDELDVSHCFKRLLAFELRFGSTDQHLAAYREGISAWPAAAGVAAEGW